MALSVSNPAPQLLSGVVNSSAPKLNGVTGINPGTINVPGGAGGYPIGGVVSPIVQNLFAPPKPPTPTPTPTLPAVVRPPTLNLASLQAKARADAQNAVNPYYTLQLNNFLAQQAAQRQQQQTIYDTGVKNLEDQLAQTQEANKTTGARTTEDVAQNQTQINQNADQFQTDTGQAADAARIAQAQQLAAGGLTGGIGAGQQEATTTQRNTAEKRQEQTFQQNRDAQELFKTRTFEDLARSGELAAGSTEKGKAAAKFDLDSFIQNQGFETTNKTSELENQRKQQTLEEEAKQQQIALQAYFNKITDPAQLIAARQMYGG